MTTGKLKPVRALSITSQTVRKIVAFPVVWRKAAKRGMCDSLGGREFLRVFREYLEFGCPDNLLKFITLHANASSDQIAEWEVTEDVEV